MSLPLLPATRIQTDGDAVFTDGLAANAAENENLVGLSANEGVIESIAIISTENRAWELDLYATDGFRNADLDLTRYLGSVRFAEGDGIQVAGAGPFYYDASNLGLPAIDSDGTRELHVALVNRSLLAKTAGAGGKLSVVITFRPNRVEV